MKVNFGFFISKFLRWLNRPALRNCSIDKTAKVGTGSNCINVKMGRYSYMGKNNSVTNTQIGAFCSIASYCAIGGGRHGINEVSSSPVFYRGRNVFGINLSNIDLEEIPPTIIGNDVWIGEGSFIKDGLNIGDGAIIGAHSVVTHDIPPFAIVAGAPAKVIKYRFSEEERKAISDSKWWEWSKDKILKNSELFKTPKNFIGYENNTY